MMLATSKHVFKIKTCRNLFKNYDLLSAVSAFWYHLSFFIKLGKPGTATQKYEKVKSASLKGN